VADLKFYRDERERWPVLQATFISEAWARRALKSLTKRFRLDRMPYQKGPIHLEFRGRSTSWGGYSGITLAESRDWLIFVHEVAHVWEYRKHGFTEHRARLAGFVDQIAMYVTERGWPESDCYEQFEAMVYPWGTAPTPHTISGAVAHTVP